MPPDLLIRTAVSADALCLGVLASQVFLDTYATEGIRPAIAAELQRSFSTSAMHALIEQPDIALRVAERRGHLIGFAQVTVGTQHATVASANPAELDRLDVQEPFTGQGLGRALLHDAEAQAVARGATILWLTPWVGNARALAFYAALGCADVGRTWFEMGDTRHENRVLTKSLQLRRGRVTASFSSADDPAFQRVDLSRQAISGLS